MGDTVSSRRRHLRGGNCRSDHRLVERSPRRRASRRAGSAAWPSPTAPSPSTTTSRASGRRPSSTRRSAPATACGPSPMPAAKSRWPARASAWPAPPSSTCWRSTTPRPACRSTRAASTSRRSAMDTSQPYQITTPRGTISLQQQGDYYVEAGSTQDPTRLGVRAGAAQIQSLNGQVLAVRAGEVGELSGDAATPQLRTIQSAPPPQPAAWADRDRQVDLRPAAAISLVRRHRLRGSQPVRHLDQRRQLRRGLGAALGAERLGALPHRPLGLRAAVGLDLDRRPAVGLRALSLRPLGQQRQSLDVGAAAARGAAGLCAGAGRLRGRHRAGGDAVAAEQRAGRLVPARSARGLRAVLHDQPRLLSAHQPPGAGPGPGPERALAARRTARSGRRPEPAARRADEPALRHRGAGDRLRALAAGDALGACRSRRTRSPPRRWRRSPRRRRRRRRSPP